MKKRYKNDDQNINVRKKLLGLGDKSIHKSYYPQLRNELHEREMLIARLEKQNEELEKFAYTISHDLKSPLVTIEGFLGLISQEYKNYDDNNVGDYIYRIRNAVTKMKTMMDDLLELSKIGLLVNEPVEINVWQLWREAVSLVPVINQDKDINIVIDESMPKVFGDKQRLLDAFVNLLSNAVKYSKKTGCLEIKISADCDETNTIFYIRDNGIGIDPKYTQRIFNMFERLSTDTEGTGIGLALVKRIIEIHNGRIWVDSKGEGKGSTFFFTLPGNKIN